MSKNNVKKFHLDFLLLGIIILLAILSIYSVHLAKVIMPSYKQADLYQKQALWYVIGFALLFILLKLGIDRLFSLSKYLYIILMFLLVVLLIDKFLIDLPLIKPISGTTAWFQIPGIGSFQPSEFMKIALILESSKIIAKHNENKSKESFKSDLSLFLKIAIIAIPPLLITILQPDTGIPIITIISLMVMVFISGIKKEWIIIFAAISFILIVTFLLLFYNKPDILVKLLGQQYKLNRFYGWLETENYSRSYGLQLYTSLLVIGSAGLTGHPINQVYISFPEPQTDFIYSVILQNHGYLGALLVIFIYILLDFKLMTIAYNSNSERERMVIIGMLGMLIFQQIYNMGMICGIFPITGITLPFISYGGSSMLSYFIPLAALGGNFNF